VEDIAICKQFAEDNNIKLKIDLSKLPKDPFNSVLGNKFIDSTEERTVQQEYR
jgi:hypothetical protein